MQTKTYTPEFRAEAVKLVLTQGLSLEEVTQRIAMPKGTLANWVTSAKCGNVGRVMPGNRTVPELEAEVARLRMELAETCMERDVVKKAAAYFAGSRCPVRVHEVSATRLPDGIAVPCFRCVTQWIICLAQSCTFAARRKTSA
jgi:transposase